MPRPYRLGHRQAAVERTSRSILEAAQRELSEGRSLSLGAVARRAGVTRATVYNRFGSRAALLDALAPRTTAAEPSAQDPREAVHDYLVGLCHQWAANPALYRHLPATVESVTARRLAGHLATLDALRPGCSLREAQDVLATLGSFPTFDRLHQDGRRSAPAVAEILMRLAAGILA
jgi:AcrR family transcriptional regulator